MKPVLHRSFLDNHLRNWTQVTIDCYERNCRCHGCPVYDYMAERDLKCTVKELVIELFRHFGSPKKIRKIGMEYKKRKAM